LVSLLLQSALRAFETHDRGGSRAVTKIFIWQCGKAFSVPMSHGAKPLARWPAAWHKHVYARSCNQSAAGPVMITGVDALLITWMILTQARWLKLRFKMTMKQLARWCDGFIRWSPRSSVHIGPVEHRRKTSAK
jgi:hypothetical protein